MKKKKGLFTPSSFVSVSLMPSPLPTSACSNLHFELHFLYCCCMYDV